MTALPAPAPFEVGNHDDLKDHWGQWKRQSLQAQCNAYGFFKLPLPERISLSLTLTPREKPASYRSHSHG